VKWTRLSCHGFEANQVRLQLHVLAYNLGNFVRRLALPASVRHWTLTTLRDKLIKIGAKVVRHVRYVTFQSGRSGHPARAVRGDPWADTPLCRTACDGSVWVTRRGPVNLRHLEGSAGFCCAHGARTRRRTPANTACGPLWGRTAAFSDERGLRFGCGSVILISEESGCGAGQGQMGNVG